MASELLEGLFGAFTLPGMYVFLRENKTYIFFMKSSSKSGSFLIGSAENEYVMRSIMRTFSCLQEQVMPFLATCLPVLTQKLELAAKNPTKPHFNHYLFEALSLSIRIVCTSQPTAVSNFEQVKSIFSLNLFFSVKLNVHLTRYFFVK